MPSLLEKNKIKNMADDLKKIKELLEIVNNKVGSWIEIKIDKMPPKGKIVKNVDWLK